MQVSLGGAALREARAELAEARKQWRSLQVEIETLHALVGNYTPYRITPTSPSWLIKTQTIHNVA